MGLLGRLLGGDDHDPVADKAKGEEVARAVHDSNAATEQANREVRAIREFRRTDDAHRAAGERLIDEVGKDA